MEKIHYCNNCGNIGHLYKECRHPILSYGIILYDDTNKKDIRIVMIERKDTIPYIEFLRGKYKTIHNVDYIKLLVSRFSIEERQRILTTDFDTLWEKLWIHTETINPRVKREYTTSKRNFNQLQSGFLHKDKMINLEQFIQETHDTYETNEWELPKGRRNPNENNRDCAIREFREETNITNDLYSLFTNIVPMVEEYTGINNVRYKHLYYVGRIHTSCDLQINMDNRDQYTEVKNIKWLNKNECNSYIRDYDDHKRKVVNEFFSFIDTYDKVVSIK